MEYLAAGNYLAAANFAVWKYFAIKITLQEIFPWYISPQVISAQNDISSDYDKLGKVMLG